MSKCSRNPFGKRNTIVGKRFTFVEFCEFSSSHCGMSALLFGRTFLLAANLRACYTVPKKNVAK